MVPAAVRNATVPPPGIGATVAVSVTATPAVGLADAVTEVVVAVVAAAGASTVPANGRDSASITATARGTSSRYRPG